MPTLISMRNNEFKEQYVKFYLTRIGHNTFANKIKLTLLKIDSVFVNNLTTLTQFGECWAMGDFVYDENHYM